MMKRVMCIDSHTDLLATAAFMNVCAAYEQAVETGNFLTSILTPTKDLLSATSYCHRNSMKYTARLNANMVLAPRDMYLSQSPFPEIFNKVLRTRDVFVLSFTDSFQPSLLQRTRSVNTIFLWWRQLLLSLRYNRSVEIWLFHFPTKIYLPNNISSSIRATNAVGFLAMVTSAVAAMAHKVDEDEGHTVAAPRFFRAQPTLVCTPESYQPQETQRRLPGNA